jgi:hypothetical protein
MTCIWLTTHNRFCLLISSVEPNPSPDSQVVGLDLDHGPFLLNSP